MRPALQTCKPLTQEKGAWEAHPKSPNPSRSPTQAMRNQCFGPVPKHPNASRIRAKNTRTICFTSPVDLIKKQCFGPNRKQNNSFTLPLESTKIILVGRKSTCPKKNHRHVLHWHRFEIVSNFGLGISSVQNTTIHVRHWNRFEIVSNFGLGISSVQNTIIHDSVPKLKEHYNTRLRAQTQGNNVQTSRRAPPLGGVGGFLSIRTCR